MRLNTDSRTNRLSPFFRKHTRAAQLLFVSTLANMSGLSYAESLQDIYRDAVKNDHAFKASEARYHANNEVKNEARAQLLPSVTGKVNMSQSGSERSGQSNNPDANLPSSSDTNGSGYSITLNQTLFNMGTWSAYKAANSIVDSGLIQFESDQQDLIIRAAQAYFDTLKAADFLETSLAEENALSHQLEQTRQRFEVGLSAITEVHEAQSVYDSALAVRLTNQGNLAIAFEGLEVLTGKSYSQLSSLQQDITVEPPQPLASQDWVARALEKNPQLRIKKLSAEEQKHRSKASLAGHFPTLSLNGEYSSGNEEIEGFSNIDTDGNRITLTLDVPLYAGGGTSASRRKAQQLAIAAREEYLNAKRTTVQQTRSLHFAVLTSVATIKARKQAIVSSQSALEATQAGYSVGTRNLIDVLNAQRSTYTAKSNYYDALYTYILNSLKLKQASGMLDPSNLTQLEQWLDKEKLVDKSSAAF